MQIKYINWCIRSVFWISAYGTTGSGRGHSSCFLVTQYFLSAVPTSGQLLPTFTPLCLLSPRGRRSPPLKLEQNDWFSLGRGRCNENSASKERGMWLVGEGCPDLGGSPGGNARAEPLPSTGAVRCHVLRDCSSPRWKPHSGAVSHLHSFYAWSQVSSRGSVKYLVFFS